MGKYYSSQESTNQSSGAETGGRPTSKEMGMSWEETKKYERRIVLEE